MSMTVISTALRSHIRPISLVDSVRLYSRWSHRKPSSVLLPFTPSPTKLKKETVIDVSQLQNAKTDSTFHKKSDGKNVSNDVEVPDSNRSADYFKEIKEKRDNKLKNKKLAISQKKVFDENNEFIYEKCKDNDGRISMLLVKLKSKKERMRTNMVLVEGWRLIVDGLEAKCPLKYIIFSQKQDLINLRAFLPKTGVKIFKIPYKEIEMWSELETSPGIFGIFETPTAQNVKRFSRPLPIQIICDNIREPGNLGAILRASSGVGCENVLLTKGCTDYWDPKVVRSAAGSHFRIPVHYGLNWEEIYDLVPKDASVFIADSNTDIDVTKLDGTSVREVMEGGNIPVLPYYGVEYSSLKSVTLIVGGETKGISEESYRFAASRNGLRLNIPLQQGVDSLNTAMATAIIAFEIKKQLLQAWNKKKMDREMLFAT